MRTPPRAGPTSQSCAMCSRDCGKASIPLAFNFEQITSASNTEYVVVRSFIRFYNRVDLFNEKSETYSSTFDTEKISEKKRYLINEKIISWIMLFAAGKGTITDFYGKEISYGNVKFEGSPRDVFWGRFIEPFLEDFTEEILNLVVLECQNNKLNIRTEIDALETNLKAMYVRIYQEMTKADQTMGGQGRPKNINTKDIKNYTSNMNYYLNQHIVMVLNKYKSKNSIKHKIIASIEEHTGKWVAAAIVVIASAFWKGILAIYYSLNSFWL